MDALRGGVLVVTGEWEVVRWNRAMSDITGVPRAAVLGRSLWSSLPELAGSTAETVLREAMRKRRRWAGLLSPSGEYDDAPVITAITPFGDSSLVVEMERTAPVGALPLTERQAAVLDRMLASAMGRRAESEALAEVARGLACAGSDLASVLQLLAERTSVLLETEGACIALLREDGSLGIEAAVGFLAPLAGAPAGPRAGLAKAALSDRSVVVSNDARNDPRIDPWWFERCDLRQVAVAPMIVEDVVVGVIGAANCVHGEFTAADSLLLQRLADHGALALRNGQLLRASDRALRHANILAESARSLALHVEPSAMYADVARIAHTALGACGIGIYLADPATGFVEMAYTDGVGAEVAPVFVTRFWESCGGRVVATGGPVFHPDVARHVDEPAEAALAALAALGVASVALLPLSVEGRPRGLLSLRFTAPQPFDAEQQRLLTHFSTHVAIAVRNALSFADLERRALRLGAIADVQRAISGAVSPSQVHAEVYAAVAAVVDAPSFALFTFDEDGHRLVPEYAVRDGTPVPTAGLPRYPLGDGATSQAFRTGEPCIAARSQAGWSGQIHPVPGDDVAVMLSAPVVHGERVLGVLQAGSHRQDAYDWSDLDLIMLIARQAGTAIANARTFQAERREREQAEAVAAVARVALSAESVSDAAGNLLHVVSAVVPCAGSALAVVDATGSAFRYAAATGSARPLLDRKEPASLLGERRTAVGHWTDAPGILVPLVSRGRVIGALGVSPVEGATLAPREAATLGRLAAPVALAIDTLLLRQEERRQQAQRDMLATALEMMNQPILVFTPDSVVRYANGAAAREFGYAPHELLGLHLQQLVVRQLTHHDFDEVRQAIESAGVWAAEQLQRRQDGSDFPAWVTASPLRDHTGRYLGDVVSVRNLTEERAIADQLRQSEKMVALGELVAGVAHEVNNPLTGISAFAQILEEEEMTADQKESVRLIKREADRAVAVIRDLLTFARKSGPRTVAINFNELLEQMLRLRSYSLRTAGVTVEASLAPDLHSTHGDDRQIQQVLLNLIVNAEHAMAGAARRVLAVRTRNERGRVVVEVADTGTGMTPEVQKRIFEPFFTTKPEGTGTGLGLSVSYGIIRAHRGSLTVESIPGAGSTFRVTLPAAPAAAPTLSSGTS